MGDNIFFKNQEQIEKYISEEILGNYLVDYYSIIDGYFIFKLPEYLDSNVEIIFKLNTTITFKQKKDLISDLYYPLCHYYYDNGWDFDFVIIVSEY